MDVQARSDTTPRESADLVAVRALLQGYHAVLQRSEQSPELAHSAWRRWLRYRIAGARMRNQLTRLARSLHSRLGRSPSAEDATTLGSIEHFQASLPPPTSTLARTGFAVFVLLLTQLLSLVPLVPVQSGAAKVPTLGTLSEALDLAPAHLIHAVSTLLHSSAPTLLTFLATLSLGLFLAFAPVLPDFGVVRRLCDDGYPASVSDLERGAARRLGCRPAGDRNLDLAIWAPLAACLICLSVAWMAAYIGGIRRYDVASTLTSTRVLVWTGHPRYLETFGAILFALGATLAWRLRVIARRRGGPPSVALPWYIPVWKAAVIVAIGFIVNRGFIRYAANHGVQVRIAASGTTTTDLALDPAIGVSIDCSFPPCEITRAALQRGTNDIERLADARASHRRHDLFEIDAHMRSDATDVPTTRVASAPVLAGLGLRPPPAPPRAKRYSVRSSAIYSASRAGQFAATVLLNDRDMHTVQAEVRRRRIFRDGTVFLPLELSFRTDERLDNLTVRVFVPVKSA